MASSSVKGKRLKAPTADFPVSAAAGEDFATPGFPTAVDKIAVIPKALAGCMSKIVQRQPFSVPPFPLNCAVYERYDSGPVIQEGTRGSSVLICRASDEARWTEYQKSWMREFMTSTFWTGSLADQEGTTVGKCEVPGFRTPTDESRRSVFVDVEESDFKFHFAPEITPKNALLTLKRQPDGKSDLQEEASVLFLGRLGGSDRTLIGQRITCKLQSTRPPPVLHDDWKGSHEERLAPLEELFEKQSSREKVTFTCSSALGSEQRDYTINGFYDYLSKTVVDVEEKPIDLNDIYKIDWPKGQLDRFGKLTFEQSESSGPVYADDSGSIGGIGAADSRLSLWKAESFGSDQRRCLSSMEEGAHPDEPWQSTRGADGSNEVALAGTPNAPATSTPASTSTQRLLGIFRRIR